MYRKLLYWPSMILSTIWTSNCIPTYLTKDALIRMVVRFQPLFTCRTNGRTIRKYRICIRRDTRWLPIPYRKFEIKYYVNVVDSTHTHSERNEHNHTKNVNRFHETDASQLYHFQTICIHLCELTHPPPLPSVTYSLIHDFSILSFSHYTLHFYV